jgi:chorismate mutase / prephenate dehydratase
VWRREAIVNVTCPELPVSRSRGTTHGSSLDRLRLEIDEVDDRIVALLDARARLALGVARLKQQEKLAIHDPDRERRVLDRLALRAESFPEESIRAVYREVIGACRALQARPAVALLGPAGTFSHAAARSIFGHSADFSFEETIAAVFETVKTGRAAYGVVPSENSSSGLVQESADKLREGDVRVRGEIVIGVSQCLLTQAASVQAVVRVYSHPQALAQCRRWLDENLRGAERIPTTSTTAAVQRSLVDAASAAIASPLAAEIHGIHILCEGIQDCHDNRTRFLVVSGAVQ